ncbi:Arginase-2, mitochondrial [Araneus ventricosus]|uniref:Arginase n=1 Tax=Araneus ventricosus TaxID=182803 RepID=A0A4Y2C8P3_ARAVE|nr:Arginase-2, mitochondrial [Araneus ventricosus]
MLHSSRLILNKKLSYFLPTRQKTENYFNRIGILGAPFNKGQPKDGVDKAPDALRKYGLIEQLQDLGLDIKDYGNLNFEEHLDTDSSKSLSVGAACQMLSGGVKKVLSDGRKCVTIGGDHSLGMGTVHGHSQVHDVCVLWVDAHPDINTAYTSLSGHIHGMPCSFLIKELKKYKKPLPGFDWLNPCVNKSNVAFIGLRDIDPFEKLILTKENILHYTMRDIDKLGIFEVTNRALEAINPTGKLSLHVSFDIDSIDKMLTPSTGTPVIGGLTVREALSIAEEVSHLDCFRAIDLVEINPKLGNKEQIENTLSIGALVLKTFLGYSRHGSLPKNAPEIPIA